MELTLALELLGVEERAELGADAFGTRASGALRWYLAEQPVALLVKRPRWHLEVVCIARVFLYFAQLVVLEGCRLQLADLHGRRLSSVVTRTANQDLLALLIRCALAAELAARALRYLHLEVLR